MKTSYKLQGLCCANCANEIETEVNKLDGISNVKLSFMTTKMSFEVNETQLTETEDKIRKIVKRIEPDVVLQKV